MFVCNWCNGATINQGHTASGVLIANGELTDPGGRET